MDTQPAIVRVIVPAVACLVWAAFLFQGTILMFQMAAYEVKGTPSLGEVGVAVGLPLVALAVSVWVAVMSLRRQGCWMPLAGLASLMGAVAYMLAVIDAI